MWWLSGIPYATALFSAVWLTEFAAAGVHHEGGNLMYLTDHARHAATAERTRRLLMKRGVGPNGSMLWTAREDDLCRRLHPDYGAMLDALPHRSITALKKRCSHLCVQRKTFEWTAKALSDLRRMYPAAEWVELRDRFQGVSPATLKRIASRYGIARKRQPYLSTGIYLLDDLRARAFHEGMTMRHLDEYAESGMYFQGQCWKGARGQVKYDKIIRAIHELGGRLSICWDDER